ncbi:MAG: 16S rRNA (adenine(1518)-N(6)/adenine(1519)-N(6))-dimethyltransferase RsmA, partial [Dehalococcoidia bacterium]
MASEAEHVAGIPVLEIGAGTGQLTQALADAGAAVVAVELDEALCDFLRRRFAGDPRVHVVCANILDHDPEAFLNDAGLAGPYAIVANIPYYITALILRRVLEARMPPRRIVLTVQQEVAESIVAAPGQMSLLSVSVQFFATATLLFRIPPTAFRPRPKVNSAVVRIEVSPAPRIHVEDVDLFFEVVRAGFRAPRKQIHNALNLKLWLPPGGAIGLLDDAGIDPMRRAQSLTLDEWRSLYEAYAKHKKRLGSSPA